MESSAGDRDEAARLADKLRLAHARVAQLSVPAEQKTSITRRLLAISDASKRDLGRAAQRLDAFLAELEVQHPAP